MKIAHALVPGLRPLAAEAPPKALDQAAREFEAIFLKQLLTSLERTTEGASGNAIYGSMVVDSMADAITRAGGLGLADEIQRSLSSQSRSSDGKS